MNREEILKEKIASVIPDITDTQVAQFIEYYEMIIEKNNFMNLTSITEYEEFVVKHFLDSLQLVRVIDRKKLEENSLSLIDIGTGAGFPGIPLKIVFPKLDVTLFDSLNKRLVFLDEVIAKLGLSSIRTVHGRAEEFGRKEEFREKFDLVVSRAVAGLSSLAEFCIPFCKTDGYFVAYKGAKGLEELDESKNALKLLNAKVDDKAVFFLDSEDNSRVLLKISKTGPCNSKYPRAGGKPLKNPL